MTLADPFAEEKSSSVSSFLSFIDEKTKELETRNRLRKIGSTMSPVESAE